MEVTFQREAVDTVLRDGRELFEAHYKQLGPTFRKPFAIDEAFFSGAEAAGALRIFTARADGKLAGYSAHAVTRHALCEVKQSQQVVFYVADGHRRAGVGRDLLSYADAELIAEGVEFLFQNASLAPMAAMLTKLGYSDIDHVFFKRS